MRALIARAVAARQNIRARREAGRLWRGTADLAELGELTARWLTGELATVPSYYGPPDAETLPIADSLAAINRAGFVTLNSQPGMLPADDGTGKVWRQRAFVDGFVGDPATVERLAELRKQGLGVVLIAPGERGRDHVPVTEYAEIGGQSGYQVTVIGSEFPPRDLQYTYGGIVGAKAYAALRKAWYLAVYDPEWGRDDRLWTALADVLGATPTSEEGASR